MNLEPREYQIRAVDACREAVRAGKRKIVLYSPTRSGKTVMGCMFVAGAIVKGKSVLWIADRRELIEQASDRMWDFGIENSIIMRGHEYQSCQVQVASKDTLWSRRDQYADKKWDVIIPDEVHKASGKTMWNPITANPEAVVIGLTATPLFPGGVAMGSKFDCMVKAATYAELLEWGFLVPTTVYMPKTDVDLKDLKRINGDYALNSELESRMNTRVLVGSAFEHWKKWGEGRQTVIFAAGIDHSRSLVEEFRSHGISAEHVDGETDIEVRRGLFKRFKDGDFQVMSNVDICTTGWDCPPLSCGIIARPTDSIVWWRQATARIQTKCDGKTDSVLIDMTGCAVKHGYPDCDLDWPFHSDERVTSVANLQTPGQPPAPKPVACPKCFQLRKPAKVCPKCGHVSQNVQGTSRRIEYVDGELFKVERDQMPQKKEKTKEQKLWLQCLAVAANRGQTVKQARVQFKSRAKHWPGPELSPMPAYHESDKKVSVLYPGFVRKKKGEE